LKAFYHDFNGRFLPVEHLGVLPDAVMMKNKIFLKSED